MSAPYTPMPAPAPASPQHTPTPANYTVGALRRGLNSRAVAIRAKFPTGDGTLDWVMATTNYGGMFASWDDVSTSEWVDLHVGFFVGGGSLTATATKQ